MNYSMPDFPVLHYHSEFAQTHVDDAIQSSYPQLPLSPLVLIFSQPQVFSNK